MELVQKYTNLYHWAMLQFNCIEPTIEPTATGHIIEQIEMIKKIIGAGYAYVVNGSVYFDVKKYAAKYPYGKLSGRILDELLETTRELEGQEEKRDRAGNGSRGSGRTRARSACSGSPDPSAICRWRYSGSLSF